MAAEAFVARLVALEQGSQQLEQRTNELDQRISASVQAHTAVHGEQIQHAQTIQRLASDLANLGAQLNIVQHSVVAAQTGGSRTNRMIDPKTMAPERFGKPHGPHWKDWSYSVKDWVAIYHHGLRDALSAAEGSTNSIGDGDLTTFGVSADVDNDLKHLLIAKTEGDAREVVRGADQKPGLEQWRKLAEKYDPRGAGRNLADTLAVLQPGRAWPPWVPKSRSGRTQSVVRFSAEMGFGTRRTPEWHFCWVCVRLTFKGSSSSARICMTPTRK